VFGEYFWVNRDFVQSYGSIKSLPEGSVLIDNQFIDRFPSIKPEASQIKVIYMVMEVI
jgi:hypothetical protein